SFDPEKMICICPAGEQLSFYGQRSDINGQATAYFAGRLNQCRNCDIKSQCMHNPSAADDRKGADRQVSFQIGGQRKRTATDWMKRRVDSRTGKQIYSHRMSVVEPVFGNIGTNKGLNRFSLRGKEKVQGQWQLFCMIQNIEELMRYGDMPA